LSERSFVRNEVVQIPKFDANPNSMPIRFRQMTLRTSELSRFHYSSKGLCSVNDVSRISSHWPTIFLIGDWGGFGHPGHP